MKVTELSLTRGATGDWLVTEGEVRAKTYGGTGFREVGGDCDRELSAGAGGCVFVREAGS